ncbi:MAG TPA: hypothetical protein DCE56_44705 [Cyanobacteria bacterium UBA8553]|nr:hypothetical protein [Cyanobacteria bacterium UBA8553]HAJ64048.1 hypothetical protein [Cyanobacteria bacterium UBA8543]
MSFKTDLEILVGKAFKATPTVIFSGDPGFICPRNATVWESGLMFIQPYFIGAGISNSGHNIQHPGKGVVKWEKYLGLIG